MGNYWAFGLGLLLVISMSVASQASEVSPPLEERGLGFLKSLPRQWSGSSARDCRTYEDKNIERLARWFAASASAFLSAFRQTHGAITITSAHRTAEEQTCVCVGERGPCAGRPRLVKRKKKSPPIVVRSISRHQLGIALDVRPGTGSADEFTCLHEFARLNPQFGVHFPLGARDRPHMEPAPHLPKFASIQSQHPIVPCTKMTTMLSHDHAD